MRVRRGLVARGKVTGWRAAPVLAGLLAAGALPAAADVVTMAAAGDNTLFEDSSGLLSNGAGPVMFAGRNNQNLVRRALVRFDVEGSVPSGAVISSVVLTLNVSNVSDPTPRVFTIHRVQKEWGEGTSTGTGGAGAPATTGDATWLHRFYPETLWTSPGGDFEPIPDASQLLGDVGPYSWSAPPMASDVQAWCDGVVPNYGWIVLGDETASGAARRFDSRENAVAGNRPTLTVTYSVTTAVGDGGALEDIVLGPCRPNPSTGPLGVRFSLPASARVELAVLDVLGRRVGIVTDRRFAAGVHDAAWDGRGLDGRTLRSGVYFLRLSVNGRPVGTRRWVRLE